VAVGQEAETAGADKAAWDWMEQEAAQELIDRESHPSLLVAMSGISPMESHATVTESDEPVVGDGNPVGVIAEITQGMFRAVERSFCVNDPFITERQAGPGAKVLG
jgi:hypothetical protein